MIYWHKYMLHVVINKVTTGITTKLNIKRVLIHFLRLSSRVFLVVFSHFCHDNLLRGAITCLQSTAGLWPNIAHPRLVFKCSLLERDLTKLQKLGADG